MARSHVVEGQVPLRFTCVPVVLFPIVAKNPAHGVAGRQRYTDAKAPLALCDTRVDQIVLMAIVHADVFSVTGDQYTETSAAITILAAIAGSFAVLPGEQAASHKKINRLERTCQDARHPARAIEDRTLPSSQLIRTVGALML